MVENSPITPRNIKIVLLDAPERNFPDIVTYLLLSFVFNWHIKVISTYTVQ